VKSYLFVQYSFATNLLPVDFEDSSDSAVVEAFKFLFCFGGQAPQFTYLE
jgi:hypothetical protein